MCHEQNHVTGLQDNDLGNLANSVGVKSDALSDDLTILARSGVALDPDLVTLCRLWPSLAVDLRERIKGMIVAAVTVGR